MIWHDKQWFEPLLPHYPLIFGGLILMTYLVFQNVPFYPIILKSNNKFPENNAIKMIQSNAIAYPNQRLTITINQSWRFLKIFYYQFL